MRDIEGGTETEQGAVLRRYLLVLVFSAALAMPFAFIASRAASLLNCNASARGPNSFMAYCKAPDVGDFEHAAYYRDLEPIAVAAAKAADVVIVGNSRVQFTFSRQQTAVFFENHKLSFYLLGFGFAEQGDFELRLMKKYLIRPKVLIINVDPFFLDYESPVATAATDPKRYDVIQGYIEKLIQPAYGATCWGAWGCLGRFEAIFRSRDDGRWFWPLFWEEMAGPPVPAVRIPFTPVQIQGTLKPADQKLRAFGVDPACVIMTNVPSPGPDFGTLAQALAVYSGANAVLPKVDHLMTFDGAHLNRDSSNRWNRAFFADAAPIIERCTDRVASPAE